MDPGDQSEDAEPDVPLEYSPLQREVERGGVAVRICIYRGADESAWLLEVEDEAGGSTVWRDPFETDQAALDEALRVIDEEGIESFAKAPPDPRARRAMWALKTEEPPLSDIKHTLEASPDLLEFHAVCGVFAAVATAPELVPPKSWLELIKGEHVFENASEVQRFATGLMALYNEVLRSVAEDGANCCPDPDDHDAVHAFSTGYLRIALADPSWTDDARGRSELLPMLALTGGMDKLTEMVPEAAKDPERWLEAARDMLSETVVDLYEYWGDRRRSLAESFGERAAPARREGPKPGRNALCACGSGKKFKRCCGS